MLCRFAIWMSDYRNENTITHAGRDLVGRPRVQGDSTLAASNDKPNHNSQFHSIIYIYNSKTVSC